MKACLLLRSIGAVTEVTIIINYRPFWKQEVQIQLTYVEKQLATKAKAARSEQRAEYELQEHCESRSCLDSRAQADSKRLAKDLGR